MLRPLSQWLVVIVLIRTGKGSFVNESLTTQAMLLTCVLVTGMVDYVDAVPVAIKCHQIPSTFVALNVTGLAGAYS